MAIEKNIYKMNKIKFNLIKVILIFFISLFLSISTFSDLFTGGSSIWHIGKFIIILMIAYFCISLFIIKLYKILITKISKESSIQTESVLISSWLLPSIFIGIVSILLLIISGYYIQTEINTLGNVEDYFILVDKILAISLPFTLGIFLISGLVILIFKFKKIFRTKFSASVLSSLILTLLIVLIYYIINKILFFVFKLLGFFFG